MGLLDKTIVGFDTAFWDTDVHFLERVSPDGSGAWEESLSLVPATGARRAPWRCRHHLRRAAATGAPSVP